MTKQGPVEKDAAFLLSSCLLQNFGMSGGRQISALIKVALQLDNSELCRVFPVLLVFSSPLHFSYKFFLSSSPFFSYSCLLLSVFLSFLFVFSFSFLLLLSFCLYWPTDKFRVKNGRSRANLENGENRKIKIIYFCFLFL